MGNRIDVHQHVMPPFWTEGMRDERRNPGGFLPTWSPESALSFMDSQDIATGILSLTTPGVCRWPANELRSAARRVNDYTAELGIKHPGRFGNFATLPLPDIESALLDLPYALDALRADGVVLFSNYNGIYLGDASFEPLWAELDKREAVVFIHPGEPPLKPIEGTPPAFVDFPFDTTRSAVNIVLRGVFDRYRKVKVILSHAGGFLPYAVYRFAGCISTYLQGSANEDTLLASFRRFYFDTALGSSPAALPSLKAFADPAHILFGSDYPYCPPSLSQHFTSMLDSSDLLTEQELRAINRRNATALFPRWMS